MILAIDTTLNALGVALWTAERGALAVRCERMDRGQAERIAPAVDETMREAGAQFAALNRIVVTTGPGSFTGVRVGLAFARGLGLALHSPVIGVSTLEALALERGADGLRGALIETPGALYAALYENGAPLAPPQRAERDEVQSVFVAAGARVFSLRGPGAQAWASQLPGAHAEQVDAPDPVALARLGAARDPVTAPPQPLYLRAALA